MNTTSMYAKLDDDGTLHLRATKYDDDYKPYSSSDSIQSNWNTANNATKSSITKVIIEEPIAPGSAHKMFWNYNKLTNIENIQNLHTENIVDMGVMFQECSSLEYLDVSKFDTEKVTSMGRMFCGCGAQNFLDLSGFNTSNVISMSFMFYGCKAEDIDVSGFDTGKTTDMSYMFASTKCKNLDLRHFKTNKVTNMFAMFFGCSQLLKLDISGQFTINTGTNLTHIFTDINRNIKITSSEDTKNKIIEVFPSLENNFNS